MEKRVHGMIWPEFISYPERVGMQQGLLLGIRAVLRLRFRADGEALFPALEKVKDHLRLTALLPKAEEADSVGHFCVALIEHATAPERW